VDEDATSPSTPSAPATNVSTSHKSTPAGAIAGGVVGGVVVLALLLGLLLFRRRTRARRAQFLPHPLPVATDTPSPNIAEKPDKLAFRAEGSIDPYAVSLRGHTSSATPNSRSAMPSSGSSRGGEIPAGLTNDSPTAAAAQSTSEESPLPPSDASAPLSAFSPATFSTEPTPSTAAAGAISSSSLPAAASVQPIAAATAQPETQQQLQSLWQEVRLLRAQQEIQLAQAETPPEYEEDE